MSQAVLAVVIPALNESRRLPALLADLSLAPAGLIHELVVVDGGSVDATPAIARLAGARLIRSEANRGRQLQVGIAATTASWLLLLHADARLPLGWEETVMRAIKEPQASWYFDLGIASAGLCLRMLERAVALRSRWRQLPYGDQGLLVPRVLLERCGGIRPWPLMEDLDLIQRLRAEGPVRALGATIQVDGRRWRRHGVLGTAWRNAQLRRAWRKGSTPQELAQRYYG
ncbi:MAG: TIGR04283 family arsenosugar biosynthesis glycosyltransferase [Vulcanococcus sp.]